MFGFLAAALVLQALPVGIVTYTELYANGGLEGVVSAFSYFHFPRAAHYFCAPFLSAVAVTMELALFIGSILGGSVAEPVLHRYLSVCCIGERSRRLFHV